MMSYQYTYSTCTRWMDGTRHNGTCGRRQPKSNKDQEEGLKSYADMTICASQARPACATHYVSYNYCHLVNTQQL